jgi:iron complex transport system substrate-binding protein
MNQPTPRPHPRVISLCPAATDALCAFGAAALLVGRSASCDHPAALGAPVLAGPHGTLFAEQAAALRADMVVLGPDAAPPALAVPIHMYAPRTVESMFDAILALGDAVDRAQDATRLVVTLRERFFTANEFVNPYADGPTTVFLESVDPLVCAGDWIAQLVERAGAVHPLNPTTPTPTSGAASGPQFAQRTAGRAVRVPDEVLVALNPERLILCPRDGVSFPEALSRKPWYPTLRAVAASHVATPPTALFHRPGPNIVDAYEWLVRWLRD